MSVEVRLDNAGIIEFFKSDTVKGLLKEQADRVCAEANAKAQSVMHSPGEPYVAKVEVGEKCAHGIVHARSFKSGSAKGGKSPQEGFGVAIEAKYHCLESSV